MKEEDQTTVIDFSDNPKHTALFFDYVIPYSINFLYKEITDNNPWITILPLKMQSEDPRLAYLELMTSLVSPPFMDCSKVGDIIKKDVRNIGGKYHGNIECFLSGYNIRNCMFLFDSNINSNCTESYDCTSLELAQIPLIDTSQTEWEQIIQFREDRESITKLRNFRLFFHENYSGKKKSFVEEDLCKRYENYKHVIKDWGFETIISSMTLLNTSVTTIGSSLAVALTGQSLETVAGTGLCVAIANILLHIKKEKKKLSILQRDHPLAYIIDAKKKLE